MRGLRSGCAGAGKTGAGGGGKGRSKGARVTPGNVQGRLGQELAGVNGNGGRGKSVRAERDRRVMQGQGPVRGMRLVMLRPGSEITEADHGRRDASDSTARRPMRVLMTEADRAKMMPMSLFHGVLVL